ncbi:MAG: tetraacyldisaccharide 4'-kinase [Chlamydiota bacterium]
MRIWEEILQRKEKGVSLSFVLSILWLISQGWRLWVFVKNGLYNKKLLSSQKVGPFVISVGNIVLGGTGKTPFVDLLTKAFDPKEIAILSRGYKSLNENHHLFVDPSQFLPSSKEMGDEPYLLAKKNSKTFFFIGKDRIFSAIEAEKRKRKILILDDGFQYRKLVRDIDIVLLQGEAVFGNGYFVPRGMLRDSPSRLKNADVVVVNEGEKGLDREGIRKELRKYTECLILFVRPKLCGFRDLSGNEVKIGKEIPITLFCAIANPSRFVSLIKEEGYAVTKTFFRRDHETFSLQEMKDFYSQTKDAYLVCTEKDAVKISLCEIPILYAEMALSFVEGEKDWMSWVRGVKKRVFFPNKEL